MTNASRSPLLDFVSTKLILPSTNSLQRVDTPNGPKKRGDCRCARQRVKKLDPGKNWTLAGRRQPRSRYVVCKAVRREWSSMSTIQRNTHKTGSQLCRTINKDCWQYSHYWYSLVQRCSHNSISECACIIHTNSCFFILPIDDTSCRTSMSFSRRCS